MIYVNKYGMLKIVDESDDLSDEMWGETMELFDMEKQNLV